MKRDYLSRVVRELHPPVTAIYGFAETLLKQKPDDALWREFIGIIASNAAQLSAVVRDLAELSLLDSRKGRDFILAPTDLGRLLQEVTAVHGAPGEGAGLKLRIPRKPLFILADRNKVMQALARVLAQIARSPAAGVKLRMFAEPAAEVGADGSARRMIGVSILARCTPESRAAGGEASCGGQSKKARTGMDLGMSVVERIVNFHGGRLQHRRGGAGSSNVVMLFPEAVQEKVPRRRRAAAATAGVSANAGVAAKAGVAEDKTVKSKRKRGALPVAELIRP